MTVSHRSCAMVAAIACIAFALATAPAYAAVQSPTAIGGPTSTSTAGAEHAGSQLESVAAKAGNTGRAVAMSMIGLAFAVAATVLAFKRDFKEAAGVFAVGIVSVLLATPAGISLLRDTVSSLVGGS